MNQIELKDFLKFKSISNLKTNQEKTYLAYTVSKMDVEKNQYTFELFVYDGKNTKKIANLGTRNQFVFENETQLLISFEKNKKDEKKFKDGKTVYYRYDILNQSFELAYEFCLRTSIIKVYEEVLILSSQLRIGDHGCYEDKDFDQKKYQETLKKEQNFVLTEKLPFFFNGRGFTEGLYSQVLSYDIKSKTLRNLFQKDDQISILGFSADDDSFYFTNEKSDITSLTEKLYQYDLKTSTTKTIYDQNDLSISRVIELDGKLVVFASDMMDHGLNQNPDIYVYENQTLVKKRHFRQSLGNSIGSDVRYGGSKLDVVIGNQYYFVVTIDDHSEIYQLDSSMDLNVIYKAKGSIDGLTYFMDKFYMVGLCKQRLQELYELDTISNKYIQKTRFNQSSLRGKYIAKPQLLSFKKNGITIKGYVLLPRDYDKKEKVKAILDIHGGPKTVYGSVYYHEMQYWANLGYVVFFCNPRGSDGKGDEFSDIFGKYGTIDYEDIINFTDKVLKKYTKIDPNQMFVTGGSYGGFMTNWIVSHTDRFKAAATQRSISNWISFYGTSDIGFYFVKDQTKGHPTLSTDKLWEQSPIKYADQVKTPLLFIHSDEDYRCPIEQALQFYTILKENGIDTRFAWFKGENHDLSRSGRPQSRVKRLEEITKWFEKYSQ